ncbi:MAG: TonB-dependent siderophore receptor [Phenylobacterium sp.]|nr:TonB-dependent siderophore receptor [Phenylobacterium sp.]
MRAALFLAAALAAGAAHGAEPAKDAPTTIPRNTYGQHLIAGALAANPQVLVMALHVTPPGSKTNVIVASNIGRLGKPADEDDLRVITSGQPNLEINKAGDRFEVEEVLKDVGGETIGALGVVFAYKAGDDKQARRAQAEAIRDKLARRIAHAGNLLDRWPYDPHYSDRIYAQALVDQTLAAHPEILILAVHATPPGSKTNVIMASNIGRIGKKADEDDLRVIEKGETNKEVNETGRRFEAELPLNNAQGKRIGALGVVFAYRPGEDKEALVARAVKIRDEMAARIASPASLVRKPL